MLPCQLFLFHHKKTDYFLLSHVQSWGTYRTHCCKSLTQHLSSCANVRSFNVSYLERSFTLSTDAINDHNWSSSFFVSQTVDDPKSCEAVTSLQILPLPPPPSVYSPYSLTSASFKLIAHTDQSSAFILHLLPPIILSTV